MVDDDRASAKLLKDIFSAQGWQVEATTTPQEALHLAAREPFDLLVSDINLEAGQNGIDLLRQMRDRCPVILITGFGTLDTTVTASREGAWDIISKPFKVDEIVAIVRRALEREPSQTQEAVPASLSAQYESAGLAGRSPAMLELYKEIARVAPSRSSTASPRTCSLATAGRSAGTSPRSSSPTAATSSTASSSCTARPTTHSPWSST